MRKKKLIQYLEKLIAENDKLAKRIIKEKGVDDDMVNFYCGRALIVQDIIKYIKGDD